MVFREIVVKCVLLCGCVGFRVGIWVRVKWVLPPGGGVRCVAGVFFLEVCLQDVDDFWLGGRLCYWWISL